MGSNPAQGKALQIMDFEACPEGPTKPRNVKFIKENLQSVLQKAGDRKVCIISIAGPSRKGKSFFLSFLIRYLEALEKDESDWLGWDNKDEPLTGFKWSTQVEHETSGMLVWDKPFIVKSNDQEIAVLLVDTQGTYDKTTTPRERAAIVGLSLLTSSCLIFNFFDMLQEDCLESLHTYINYGLMAMNSEEASDDDSMYPFQRLYFLIRDWRMPTRHPFGAEGGKAFLEKVLKIEPSMPPNVKQVRETLRKCFERMDCFLMPGIGDKAQQEGFNGSLSQLSDKFCNKLEELVDDLLNPDDIPIKSVFGSEIMAADILSYFEQYVNIFNCEDTPSPLTLIEATSKIAFQSLVSESLRKYQTAMKRKRSKGKKFLPHSVLKKTNETCHKDALDSYTKARKMGNAELANAYKNELIELLKAEFIKIRDENDQKRHRMIDESRSEVLKGFRDSMAEEFPDEITFVDPRKLKVLISTYKDTALEDFKEKVGSSLDETCLESEMNKLEIKLEEEETRVTLENQNRKMKAEQKMDELVDSLRKNYSNSINEELMVNSFMSEDEFHKLEQAQRTSVNEAFDKSAKLGGKDFVKIYAKKLEESLTKAEEELSNSYKLRIQEAEKEAESVLDEAIKDFEQELGACDDIWEDSELQSKCAEMKQKSLNTIQKTIQIPKDTELAKSVLEKAQSKLESTANQVMKDLSQAKHDCEECYVRIIDDCLEHYVAKLDLFLNEKFHTDEDLENEHETAKKDALEKFDAAPKKGNHPEPSIFLDQLETKIRDALARNRELNKNKREAALSKATNFVNEIAQKYQSDIMKDIDSIKDMDDLEEHHKLCLKESLKSFDEKMAEFKDEEFAKPYCTDLQAEIMKAYEDDLKDYVELKLRDRGAVTNNALAEARKTYKEEMEKHYKGTVFMRPADLEALHNKLSATAITKCEESTSLSDIQKEDLKSALDFTYKQYKEKNDMNVPVDPAIGIDLGTTYSCVAVYIGGAVKVIPNGLGKNITPSYVCYNDAGFMQLVGNAAKSKAYENAENTIFDAKRILGKDFTDEKLQNDMTFWPFQVVEEQKVPKIRINSGKTFYPEQVSSEVLKQLRMDAEGFLNCEVKKAVITVPAYFTDGQRQATIDAGELAGLEVLMILNEPTSAAIAHKLQHSEDHFRHVLVYDLGGGTFDVAVLKISKGNIEALAVDGDTHLGGQDFDQRVMEYCCLEFQKQEGIDLMEGKDSTNAKIKNEARGRLHRLQQACEEAKKELSTCRTTNLDVPAIYVDNGQSFDLKISLSRNKFEELNEDLIEKTLEFVEKVLSSARVDKSKIEDVVLVGGSTRIPKVQEVLQGYFEGKALSKDINPDEAVAYGAAVQAAILNGKIAQESIDFNKIQDVTPMSLGVEVYGGGFSCIIPKNTKVPAKIKDQYRTAHNNQTSVQITIYQGESDVAVDNTWLGEFYLNGIPPADAGRELIDVTMEIDLQGVMQITAVSTSTGDTNSIKVTADKRRMGQSTIKKILAEAKAGGA